MMKQLAFVGLFLGLCWISLANAGDVSWSGRYRVEGVTVNNPEASATKREKSYLLHHLVLQPKIVAMDGFNVFGRFDLLNQNSGPYSTYPNQIGDYIGSGPGTGSSTTSTSQEDSNSLAKTQKWSPIQVSEVYLQWQQEFGSLLAGRFPLQFGLGMTYSAGDGEFDHWFTSRDGVGFRWWMGNLSIMPIYGKVNEGQIDQEDDVNDYMVHLQYENPETNLALGVMYDLRTSTQTDVPVNATTIPDATTRTGASGIGGENLKIINIFVQRSYNNNTFSVGTEAGFITGATGIKTATGDDINMNAFGLALELNWKPSTVNWNLKAGMASGDDPATAKTYEGFTFDRNYHVGMLLFNHVLGQYDLFGTTLAGRKSPASQTLDTEAIGNVTYASPAFEWMASEKWSWGSRLVWASLSQSVAGGQKDVGYEVDLTSKFRPNEKVVWMNEVGLLSPGAAFAGVNGNTFDKGFCYGLTTKLSVGF